MKKDFCFEHFQNFEERYVEMKDDKKLHALLFRTEDPRGLVFYLHGNAGSLAGWGSVAETFTTLKYDIFIPDYRGYGKSEGTVQSEAQLHEDMQTLYDRIKEEYPENEIIVLGHSIGSGMAARLAAVNNPKLLILQAPTYSLPDLVRNTTPLQIFPSFLLRYKLETGKYVSGAKMPVVVLHGDQDEVVYYGSSLKLKGHFKPGDTLITLEGLGHNNFLDTMKYKKEIGKILSDHQ
ncbi:alpha/beta hydrolase [Salinimicrobium flavum]|uniref:alpha/beta hydrolase n=1 Tax=Salinimicrobium flavum TaxID=1737065 RepID=UPI0036D3EC18